MHTATSETTRAARAVRCRSAALTRAWLPASLACALLLALAPSALAHGGAYRGGRPGPKGGTAVPPGTADPPGPTTSWQSWWAANKEFHLRLHTKMRESDDAITPSARGDGTDEAAARATAREAADALLRERLVPVLLEALADDSFEVRTSAAIALGKLGDDRARKPLRHALERDSHNDVRDSAALALGMLGSEENIPYLVGLLHDADVGTRRRSFAAFGLGLIGGEDAASMLQRFHERGRRGKRKARPQLVASTLVAMGLTGCPEIVLGEVTAATTEESDQQVRAYAVLSLGRLAQRSSLAHMTRLLRDKNGGVRRSAAIGLGRIARAGDKEAVAALLRAVDDDADANVRHFSAVSLGGIADDAVRERLRALFDDARLASKPFLALSLALASDEKAIPAIRKAYGKERDKSVRGGYALALGLLGDVGAATLLRPDVADRGHIWLSSYAALSLAMLQDKESAPVMRERLADSNDPRHRMNLAVALGLLHDPAARRFLEETVKGDGSVYERGSAAMSLGVLRRNESADLLLDVYRDKDEQEMVRAFAIVALGVLADPSPVPKLARFSIGNNYTIGMDPLNEVLSIL